jgi:hypothetical protein
MSILFGIDMSLDDRLARHRLSSPQGRRKMARPETGLIVVERKGLQRARGCRIGRSGVDLRRDLALVTMDLVCDARSWHDLPGPWCGSAWRRHCVFSWLTIFDS